MKVLVACEFSGAVRDEFAARGHNAWSCDLLPSDKPGQHLEMSVLHVLEHDPDWDLMIAHPPCTWLCQAMLVNSRRKDRPKISDVFERKREDAFKFVLSLFNAPIPKIAIENPFGYLNYGWRKPDQTIGAWMFGHPLKKKLCLWLKNLPLLQPTVALFPPLPYKTLDFWSDKRNPNGRSLKSITLPGIAKAMAEQWG